MGPLVAPADSDVLSVQRLDALNSSFHRGYMQQKQQAEANAKLPLIQAESKVGIAKAKEELEDMQDPDRALVRKKTRELGLKTLAAGNRKLDEDTQMAAQDFAKRQAMAIFEMQELERNNWRVNEMADFLSKQGVNYDWNPNDKPEVAAQKLKETITDYRKFVQWSASAKAELDQLKTTPQVKTVGGENGAKKEYTEYVSYGPGGFVPQERVNELKLAQLMTFEQFKAYSKVFQKFAQSSQGAAAPQPPATSGYQPNVPLTNPNAAPVSPAMPATSVDQPMAAPQPAGDSPDVSNAILTSVTQGELPNAPAEIIRQFSALVEAPGLLQQIRRSYENNRADGKVPYTFTIPGLKDDEGKPITFDLAPITGLFANKNPWDVKAVELNQAVGSAVATFARGIFREVGVLSDKDVLRYKDLLPGAKTPEGAAKLLFAILDSTLDRSAMVASILNYDTKQGRKLADMYGFTKEKLDAGQKEYSTQIAENRAAREALADKPKSPEAAAASFVKQYGVQPPPPGLGLAPHPDNPGTLIYVDMNTGEWFPAKKAQ